MINKIKKTCKCKCILNREDRGKTFCIINSILFVLLISSFVANQFVIAKTDAGLGGKQYILNKLLSLAESSDKKDKNDNLAEVDVNAISSTAQAVAALFPLKDVKNPADVMAIMIPKGIPDYGEAMSVNYDDPEGSMNKMADGYKAIKDQAKKDPAIWERYLKLAAAPKGISCEFCCGLKSQGVDEKGESMCGCKHNPALQTVTMWLMMNTDYNDAQILKEAMKWKTLWFPKDMVGLATKISGGDSAVLEDLPAMVGGC